MTFKLGEHSIRPGVQVIEVYEGDRFIATIVPGDLVGELRIITKHAIMPALILGNPIVLTVRLLPDEIPE